MKKYFAQMQSKTSMFSASLLLAALPSESFAQTTNTTGVIANPLGTVTSIPNLIAELLGYVVKIGGVIAIFAFIYSGYKFVAARGNPKELEVAKTIFINTCIGVAILLGAQLIASIIVGTIKNLQS